MANELDKQIREKIGEIIKTAYPDAVVYAWNALSHKLGDWPGLFQTDDGIHGWIIKRSSHGSDWKQLNGHRDRRRPVYDIWGFYEFRTGKQSDNSDNEFGEICDTVYDELRKLPRLNFDGTVEMHELLQFVNITTMNVGEKTLHFAQGRLTVLLCC